MGILYGFARFGPENSIIGAQVSLTRLVIAKCVHSRSALR